MKGTWSPGKPCSLPHPGREQVGSGGRPGRGRLPSVISPSHLARSMRTTFPLNRARCRARSQSAVLRLAVCALHVWKGDSLKALASEILPIPRNLGLTTEALVANTLPKLPERGRGADVHSELATELAEGSGRRGGGGEEGSQGALLQRHPNALDQHHTPYQPQAPSPPSTHQEDLGRICPANAFAKVDSRSGLKTSGPM